MDHRGFDTMAVCAGELTEPEGGPMPAGLVLRSTFPFRDAEDAAARFAGQSDLPVYSRWSNPTVAELERKLAALEGGAACAAFASGMGAVHAAVASSVMAGDHVVAARSLYAETARLLRGHFGAFEVQTTFVDATDAARVADAITPATRLIVVETPANPTLAITDIEAVAGIKGEATLLVDSTFATPFHQRPLALGADLVVHSATKSLCGHGDAIGGVLIGDPARVRRAREVGARTTGAPLAPFNAWLINRGVSTLGLRMARASQSAQVLAEWLIEQPEVTAVHYPGLPSHPGHEVAARQMERGYGAVLAFELEGGRESGARLYDSLDLIERAVSLGDVRSLVTHPASTTHSAWTEAQRAAASIGEGLLRMSVGVEAVEDLQADLEAGLRTRSARD